MLLDLYEILDIPTDAGAPAIKAAYRRQVKRFHPDLADRNQPGDRAKHEALTRLVNHAYEVLSDPAQRAVYDQERMDHLSRESGLRHWDPARPPDFDEIAEIEQEDYHPPVTASERRSMRLTAYLWSALGIALLLEFLLGFLPLGDHFIESLAVHSLRDALWYGGQLAVIAGLVTFILAQVRPESASRAGLAALAQGLALLATGSLVGAGLAFDGALMWREAGIAARLILLPPVLIGLAVVMLDVAYALARGLWEGIRQRAPRLRR